jgi:HSP20 family molecular chaperone IbpA
MQSTQHTLKRIIPKRSTLSILKPTSTTTPIRHIHSTPAKMSGFFPRYFNEPEVSFTPLFRLLDDFTNYQQHASSEDSGAVAPRSHFANFTKTFSPKFDVKEVADAYELHGELPGIDQKDVEIEFTDPQTLAIRGRSERSHTSGTPPDRLLGQGKEQAKLTESGESHRASVADEEAEKAKEAGQQVQKTEQKGGAQQPQEKYWVSERSVGEFSRSFHFPSRVDQDAVKASMKNGILSIVVPKAQNKGSRKINIE